MKNHYRYIWSEYRSLINVESHIRQYIEQRHIFGSGHSYSFIYAKDGFAEELHRDVDNAVWVKLGKQLLRRKFVEELIAEGHVLTREFASFVKILHESDLGSCSDSELKKLFVASCKYHSKFRGYFKISREEFMATAENELKRLLAEKFTKYENRESIFEVLTSPAQMDDVNLELLDRVTLVHNYSPSRLDDELLLKHALKHPWLIAHSHNLSSILSHLKSGFQKDFANKKELNQKVGELKLQKKRLGTLQRKYLKIAKSKKINYLSWLSQAMSIERMRLKGSWAGSDFIYLPLYKEISRRTSVSLRDLFSVYRIGEVVKAINDKKGILSPIEKIHRKSYYVLWLKNKKLYFYSGKKASTIINERVAISESKQEVKG